MRDIKFRAWDKKLLKWNLSVEISCFGEIQEYKFNGSAFHPKYQTDEDEWYGNEKGADRFVLCQFTGLQDKNGVDIYEGDILEVHNWGLRDGVIGISTIVWDNDNCGWRLSDCQIAEDFYDERRAIIKSIVIGNIYENPELLNNG